MISAISSRTSCSRPLITWIAPSSATSMSWPRTTSMPMSSNDYRALPGFVRTASSVATWIANRLAGSLALAFSLTK